MRTVFQWNVPACQFGVVCSIRDFADCVGGKIETYPLARICSNGARCFWINPLVYQQAQNNGHLSTSAPRSRKFRTNIDKCWCICSNKKQSKTIVTRALTRKKLIRKWMCFNGWLGTPANWRWLLLKVTQHSHAQTEMARACSPNGHVPMSRLLCIASTAPKALRIQLAGRSGAKLMGCHPM